MKEIVHHFLLLFYKYLDLFLIKQFNKLILSFYRPCDRNLRDVELISCRLRRVEPLCRLSGSALQQLAMCGFYEDLEKGVTCKSSKKKHFFTNLFPREYQMKFSKILFH